MNAADIMTRDVVTVTPETDLATVAQLLLEHDISALPVVDEQRRVVGIVSEGDLLGRPSETSTRGFWLRLFRSEAALEELATARHLKVADVMTRRVVTVTDQTPIEVVASLMHRRKLKRVPVLHDGQLVGIISRVDVIGGLVGRAALSDLC
jgi:CBS-domain-containing membrane protein